VVRELPRHANSCTLETYTQTLKLAKREVKRKVMKLIRILGTAGQNNSKF